MISVKNDLENLTNLCMSWWYHSHLQFWQSHCPVLHAIWSASSIWNQRSFCYCDKWCKDFGTGLSSMHICWNWALHKYIIMWNMYPQRPSQILHTVLVLAFVVVWEMRSVGTFSRQTSSNLFIKKRSGLIFEGGPIFRRLGYSSTSENCAGLSTWG